MVNHVGSQMAHAKNIGEPFVAHAKNLYDIPCNNIVATALINYHYCT